MHQITAWSVKEQLYKQRNEEWKECSQVHLLSIILTMLLFKFTKKIVTEFDVILWFFYSGF